MSGQPRSLPPQPSLRYLKLEAKRRLSAGEFTTLHAAQLGVAREHGYSSWNALRQAIEARDHAGRPVVVHLRWIISRFSGADGPAWTAPAEDELAEHFADWFLHRVTPGRLVRTLASQAGHLSSELTVRAGDPLRTRAQAGGMQLEAVADPEPPHRLVSFRMYPGGGQVNDPRVAGPGSMTAGTPPAGATATVGEALAESGLPGLAVAGSPAAGDTEPWVVTCGWADLAAAETLLPGHRFPVWSVTRLVTATAVLRLAADGAVALDDPANRYLRTVRLSNDDVTIRELLSHTGGVDTPFPAAAGRTAQLEELAGPVLSCSGIRGEFTYSDGGYAALGDLIAEVSGSGYAEAVTRIVLAPLGMTGAFFPDRWPAAGTGTVTGYRLAASGSFAPAIGYVCPAPAAGGLWSTAADLARFGARWASLLPETLSREALTPQSGKPGPVQVGLGWHVNEQLGLAGQPGGGDGGSSSLVLRLADGAVQVALANRRIPVEPVSGRMLRLAS
jgi:CubicO group peptidase (beta-lactamase class C family)